MIVHAHLSLPSNPLKYKGICFRLINLFNSLCINSGEIPSYKIISLKWPSNCHMQIDIGAFNIFFNSRLNVLVVLQVNFQLRGNDHPSASSELGKL